MKQPIIDKAEVSIDFPDKFYAGSFGRGSTFDLRIDEIGLHLTLERGSGSKRRVGVHLHHYLLCEILDAMAAEVSACEALTENQRKALQEAARALADSAAGPPRRKSTTRRQPPGGRRASPRDR